MKYTN
jgi:hypothetical protein